MLLLRFNSGTCLLPVNQSAHPREAIPAKLLHGSELIGIVQPFPITIQIPVTNFAQRKPVDKHGSHYRVGHMMEQIESTCLSAQCQNVDIESLKTYMIVLVNGAHFSDRHKDLLEVLIRAHILFG